LEKEYFSTQEVARTLGVTTGTVWGWIKKGKLKGKQTITGRWAIHKDDLKTFLGEKHRNDEIKEEKLVKKKTEIKKEPKEEKPIFKDKGEKPKEKKPKEKKPKEKKPKKESKTEEKPKEEKPKKSWWEEDEEYE